MKKLLILTSILMTISNSLIAANSSAIIKGDLLYVTTITDNCNTYVKAMKIDNTCSNSGLTKECHPINNISIEILPRTRKNCSGIKAQIFEFDLSGQNIQSSDLSLTVNEEMVGVERSGKDDITSPVTAYKCREITVTNNRCRMIGGCGYTKINLFKNNTFITDFPNGTLEEKKLECARYIKELENDIN